MIRYTYKSKPGGSLYEAVHKNTLKRALISVAVFAVIYLLSGPIIGWTGYDMNLKSIEFLSAVIGAGCYWIGSNQK